MPLFRLCAAVCSTFVLLVVCAYASSGSNSPSSPTGYTTLIIFQGGNGANPLSVTPIQAANGAIYGTTTYGGIGGCPPPLGCGIVYAMAPSVENSSDFRALWYFTEDGTGGLPSTGLLQATDGNFYGTTTDGGADGCGTIFKTLPDGTTTTIYTFDCVTAGNPQTALVQGLDDTLYGTTGATIYKIGPTGDFSIAYNFCPDCGTPFAPSALTLGADGNFYGAAAAGGPGNGGSIFQFNAQSGTLTTLYNFCSLANCADGSKPFASLVQAADGAFYGVTSTGGVYNDGTVFRITAAGKLTTLHSFSGIDGFDPTGSLSFASDGNLYGTTQYGGAYYDNGANIGGTIFRISPSGAFRLIYNMCSTVGCDDGENPWGGLLQYTDGNFYGETYYGGSSTCVTLGGCGVIYEVSLNLRPFVQAQLDFGKPGTTVHILGSNLSGATAVTFDGTPAQFSVVSKSEILATVPGGARIGKIEVTVPSGTLSTVVPFRVLQ